MSEEPKQAATPKRRGIFHPAFLEAHQKVLVIEFLVARSVKKVEEAFASGKIGHVTASYVRGIEDIVIRRYVQDSGKLGSVPSVSAPYSVPFCRLTPDEFAAAFDTDGLAPYLRVLIAPKHFMKFRGIKVTPSDEPGWLQLCQDITPVARRSEDIEQIVSVATEVAPDAGIPPRYASVFSLGVEDTIELGRETQNRETFLFVATEGEDGSNSFRRMQVYLNEALMDDSRVRDICRLTLVDVNPASRNRPFEFMLRLKCPVFDTDDIITNMREWGSKNKVRVGTRSYDVFRNIARAGVRGIFVATLSPEEIALQKALSEIDPGFAFERREIQEHFAQSIAKHTRVLNKGKFPDDWDDVPEQLKQLIYFICLFNCTKENRKKRVYRHRVSTQWNALYNHLETGSKALLENALGLPGKSSSRRDILMELMRRYPQYFHEDERRRDAGFFKWFGDFYDLITGIGNPLARDVRSHGPLVMDFRNKAVHADSGFEPLITIDGADWMSRFEALDKKMESMCQLLAGFAVELDARGIG